MRGRRWVRGLDRLLEHVPGSEGARAVADLVREDLASEDDLADLLGMVLEEGAPGPPRIRPVLVALTARATGAARVDPELQHAAELLHRTIVLHDLALGREGGRRRRAARRILHRSVGWLSGHQATIRALELARHTSSPEVLTELVDTLREISDGQSLDAELQAAEALPTREDWIERADTHSGAVYAFCCRAGAHLGGAESVTVTGLGRYGRHVGRLSHLAEDVAVLHEDHDPDDLIDRLLAGRPLLPVLAAAQLDTAADLAWRKALDDPSPDALGALRHHTRRAGGLAAARQQMAIERWAAVRALQVVPATPYRAGMERLATSFTR